jgi:8-oxo-dGTP diphosphatase
MEKNKVAYIGVKGLIVNGEGKVLITQEPTHFVGGGKWELPGGKIANGEDETPLEEILLREIQEELGDKFKVEIKRVIDIMRRPWNKPGASADQVMLAVYECSYLSGHIQLSDENVDSAWVTAQELAQYEFISGYLPVLKKYFSQQN